jgi:hypothetical protein
MIMENFKTKRGISGWIILLLVGGLILLGYLLLLVMTPARGEKCPPGGHFCAVGVSKRTGWDLTG